MSPQWQSTWWDHTVICPVLRNLSYPISKNGAKTRPPTVQLAYARFLTSRDATSTHKSQHKSASQWYKGKWPNEGQAFTRGCLKMLTNLLPKFQSMNFSMVTSSQALSVMELLLVLCFFQAILCPQFSYLWFQWGKEWDICPHFSCWWNLGSHCTTRLFLRQFAIWYQHFSRTTRLETLSRPASML